MLRRLPALLVILIIGLVLVVDCVSGRNNLLHLRQRTTSAAALHNNTTRTPFDEFPVLDDVSEMANLSHSVYQYKKYPNASDVCADWNNKTGVVHREVACHWYRHDKTLGTQVMIVSSSEKDYLAVVFAGTDDLLTTLLDIDLKMVNFGTRQYDTGANASKIPVSLDHCPKCKVHEGFNNAVFCNHIFDDIYIRVEALRPQFHRLFVTGHSLGAAGAMMTAVGLALEFEKKTIHQQVTSLNFGGPQIGNADFQHYISQHFLSHANTTRHSPYLSIWRFVLGWDLVPRLPVGYYHIGHTVQMHHPECKDIITDCYNAGTAYHHPKWVPYDNVTKEALTYYHHYGNATLHYAGVPSGWSAKPYLWVPGALASHAIKRYAEYLYQWETWSPKTWIQDFVPVDDDAPPNNNHSDALIDDDTYAEPPDDDAYAMALIEQEEEEEGLWQQVTRRLWNWAR